jgi:hypothetical protein
VLLIVLLGGFYARVQAFVSLQSTSRFSRGFSIDRARSGALKRSAQI